MKFKPETLLKFLHLVRDPSKVETRNDCRRLIKKFAHDEKNESLKEVLKYFDRKVSGNKGELSKRLLGLIDTICDDESVQGIVEELFPDSTCIAPEEDGHDPKRQKRKG